MAQSNKKLDVFTEIKIDHDNLRDLRVRFDHADESGDIDLMGSIANTFVREAARHVDAEEMSLYNTLLSHGFKEQVESNKRQHRDLKVAVAKLDEARTPPRAQKGDLIAAFNEAWNQFVLHVPGEEEEQLPKLRALLSVDDNDRVAREFLRARRRAPTHSHPSAPQSGGTAQAAAALAVKPTDGAINLTRSFVELRYRHGDELE